MATVKSQQPKAHMIARDVQNALIRHFNFMQQLIVPNCSFAAGECDLLVISANDYATEVEIKVSLADWQNDKSKAKWAHEDRSKITRFFYAVPWYLADKCPEWVPSWAGIIAISPRGHVTIFRGAKRMGSYKVSADEKTHLMRSIYCRYHSMRAKINGTFDSPLLFEEPYNNDSNTTE